MLSSQGDAKRSAKILRGLFVLMSLEISDDTIGAMTDVCQQCSSLKHQEYCLLEHCSVILFVQFKYTIKLCLLPRQAERSAA